MTESNADSVSGLIVILALSVLLVSGLLLWHPWSGTTETWIAVPQQPAAATPDDSVPPAPAPDTMLT